MGASIYDIACRTGLSTATVSRVIHNKNNVRPQTVEKVRQAIQELDYVTNQMAQGLAKQQSPFIGVVVPRGGFTKSQYVSECLEGIGNVLEKSGFHIVLLQENDGGAVLCEQYLKGGLISGVLAISESVAAQSLNLTALKKGCCVGYIGEPHDDYSCNVYANYKKYITDILHQFHVKGHEKVMLLDISEAHQKLIKDEIEKSSGVSFPRSIEYPLCSASEDANRASEINKIVESAVSNGVTGILTESVWDAGCVLLACQKNKLSVPLHMSLATVEQRENDSAFLMQPIDAYSVPSYRMGAELAEMLLGRLKGEEENARQRMISGKFIERGSIAAPYTK